MSGDVAAVRASIDAQVAGKTLCHILERNVREYGDKPALSWEEDGAWQHLTWREYRDRVAELTMGLKSLGIDAGDFVAIQARNRPEHLIADLAVVHTGGTPVSFYNTLAPDQIAYIAGHCEAKVAFVEDKEFLERWEKVRGELPKLEKVVLLFGAEDYADSDWVIGWDALLEEGRKALAGGRSAFEETWKNVKPDDIATLIYTSGTTGNPKGVVLTHYNAVWTAASMFEALYSNAEGQEVMGQKYVSYLPLAHSAERTGTHYVGLYLASHVHFCPDILRIFEVVPQVRPASFVGVPRVWEKVQAGIMAGIQAEPDEKKRNIALKAIATGREAAQLEREGKTVPIGLRLKRAVFDKLVFSKIRHKIGLDECLIPLTGAAPISTEVHEFFAAIGLPLVEIYGMTETTAPAISNIPGEQKIGTVGRPLPGVEIKVAEDGELLMRGGNITQGYYKEDEKTAEALDDEGWLHSGDVVEVDAGGFVKIVDRKKELIITAGGKNISPANIEGLLKRHPLIGQACSIGDQKPFVSALIVLDGEVAPGWANQNGIEASSVEELAQHPKVQEEIQRAVDDANQHLSRVEQVKKFQVLPTEWTVESEELTPSMKLKRRVVHQKYSAEIESLYSKV